MNLLVFVYCGSIAGIDMDTRLAQPAWSILVSSLKAFQSKVYLPCMGCTF